LGGEVSFEGEESESYMNAEKNETRRRGVAARNDRSAVRSPETGSDDRRRRDDRNGADVQGRRWLVCCAGCGV